MMSRVLKLLVGATFISQIAVAQPADIAAPEAAPQVDVTVPQQSSLTPQEMLTQVTVYRTEMMQTMQRLESMVESARKQKDVIKLNCLADKLVQAKANANVAEKAEKDLQDAAARKDDAAALHEFTRITIINQKVQVLGAEAEGCVGEELQFVGATKVDVEVDDDVRTDDVTTPQPASDPYQRPEAASPFM